MALPNAQHAFTRSRDPHSLPIPYIFGYDFCYRWPMKSKFFLGLFGLENAKLGIFLFLFMYR